MIAQRGRPTNPSYGGSAAALAALLLLIGACGKDDPASPGERLCGGETGLGLLIEGRADPLEFCVDDPDVSVVLTSQNRYDVRAEVSTADGTFVVRMVFAVRSFPATLRITDSLAETTNDPGVVWLYYEEIPAGGDPIESFAVTGGTFTLSFVDADVATGVLKNVVFEMRDFSSGDPAGQRKFADGMFSISTKEPTAAARRVAAKLR